MTAATAAPSTEPNYSANGEAVLHVEEKLRIAALNAAALTFVHSSGFRDWAVIDRAKSFEKYLRDEQ